MDNNTNISQEKKDINEKIRKEIFDLERENYLKKTLSPIEMIAKIKKIVEEAVK